MAINYDQATQNARLDATLARLDNHASPASIEICSAAYAATLVVVVLADPSFSRGGTIPNTALTALGVPKSGVSGTPGTAAVARIKDGGGTVIVNNLTVGTSGGFDVVLNSLTISAGQTVTISSAVITHAA